MIALRSLIRRAVLWHVTQPEARLRWLVNIRNGLLLLEDWQNPEMILLEEAQRECVPFLEEARSHMAKLERTQGSAAPRPTRAWRCTCPSRASSAC